MLIYTVFLIYGEHLTILEAIPIEYYFYNMINSYTKIGNKEGIIFPAVVDYKQKMPATAGIFCDLHLSAEYRGPDLNRHGACAPQDFKSCASTNSATPARSHPCKTETILTSEAPGGFEPSHKGFADLSLTTWVRRQIFYILKKNKP